MSIRAFSRPLSLMTTMTTAVCLTLVACSSSSPGTGSGGSPGTGGTTTGGTPGTGGSGGAPPATGGTNEPSTACVTSAPGDYWKAATCTETTSGTADVTVNDTAAGQTWEGFGGAFNELGWSVLTTKAMQDQAVQLLFGADGAHFAWGRIPIGASDYATTRYTLDDPTGADPIPNSGGTNRPTGDLSKFSIERDGQKLIPYIKAAKDVNASLRFWASPWTPPIWMKTGYKMNSGDPAAKSSDPPKRASFFDGGNMNAAHLGAYADYFAEFVKAYKGQGINVEIVSPQNEPGYDQNYPSCLWDKGTYTTFVGKHLGPKMEGLGVKVMLGTMSNPNDTDIATAVLADADAKKYVTVAGVQWGALDKVNAGTKIGSLPTWATEHMCGNYPFRSNPPYNKVQAPNDQAYGVESWGYIRDAITKGKVTSYSAWNMVLDKIGLGNDTSRDWRQDALLVADGGNVIKTPAYHVFRHFSQYVEVGAKVVGTQGGDAVAFKNPDGTLVVVMFNKDAAKAAYTVSIGGTKVQVSLPSQGWATIKR